MKKGIKKFALLYEPNRYWNNKQYIVDFKLNKEKSVKFIEIDKNSNFSGIRNGKELLSDIDRITNGYDDIYKFSKEIGINASIHSMFINTSPNKYTSRIVPVFNNERIESLLNVTQDDFVISNDFVHNLYDKLFFGNSSFFKYFLSLDFFKTVTFKNKLQEAMVLKKYNIRTGNTHYENDYLYQEARREVLNELKKYYVAREVTRAYSMFEQKIKLYEEETEKEKIKIKEKKDNSKKNKDEIDSEDLQYKMIGW